MAKRMPLPEDYSQPETPMPGFAGVVSRIPKAPPRETVSSPEHDVASAEASPNAPVSSHPAPLAPGSKILGREMALIDVNLVDPNPLAPREVYTAEMIKARADALRTQGQHDPIHIIPNPEADGRYIIADGWTRIQACREHLVLPNLLAEIHRGMSVEEAAWFGYRQNEEREQHCDLDRAMFYEKMIAAGTPASKLATMVGLNKSTMSTYRAFAKLPENVLDIVKTDTKRFTAYPVSYIQRVSEKLGATHGARLAAEFASNGQSHTWLVTKANTLLEPKKKKATNPSINVRYRNGYYKNQGQNFSVSLTVPEEKLETFKSQLEALLETVADTSYIDGAARQENFPL